MHCGKVDILIKMKKISEFYLKVKGQGKNYLVVCQEFKILATVVYTQNI